MGKNNDWVAINLYNSPSSFEDVALHGVTADNTKIESRDYYKSLDPIKEKFTENGKFNEEAFDNFYNSCLSTYNEFSTEDWTNKLISSMAKDSFDWMQPLKTNVKDISVTIQTGLNNPERRSMGIAGINSIGDPVFSAREIAQDNYARDAEGNSLGWTPNQKGGLFKSIFRPTLALATYDEDGYDTINGRKVFHRKGDFKTDENGDYYYEELGSKDGYGKEILRWTDTLTIDGTKLNKFDIFDQDSISTSVGKTVARTAAQILPLLTPFGEIYGAIGVATGLAGVLPTLGKAINGIFGDNDSDFGRSLTKAENWVQRFKETSSDTSKEHFMTLETIGNIMSSSARQLYSQKTLGNLAAAVSKGGKGALSSKLGQNLSLAYLAVTSSDQAYADFKEAGASDTAAGIGMLATIAGLYELMGTDYFRRWFFKGSFMDESEAIDVLENFKNKEAQKVYDVIGKDVLTQSESKDLFNTVKNSIKEFFKNRPELIGKSEKLATSAGKAWGAGKTVFSRSVNEGIEEVMEEVESDAVKALFTGMDALGIPVREQESEKLDFGWDVKEMVRRYATTFLGGALGGATFEAIEVWNNHIGPKIVKLSDRNALQQMEYLIITGHADELRDRAKVMYDKGRLGNKNLSATETVSKKEKDDAGNEVVKQYWAQGTEDNNQNLFNYKMILNQIAYLENQIHAIGASLLNNGIDPETGLPKGNDVFNRELKRELDEEKEMQVDSQEYIYRNKENALTRTIEHYKLEGSYVNDMVDLATDILVMQADLATITQASGNSATEHGQQLDADNLAHREDVKYLTTQIAIRKESLKDLMSGRNDDVYAHEALFVTDNAKTKGFIGFSTGMEEADKNLPNPYWTQSKEAYAKVKYGKDFYALSDKEQEYIEKEYEKYKTLKGADQLLAASDVHYNVMKAIDNDLRQMNEVLKDKTLDNYYDHGHLAGESSEFSMYEDNQAEYVELEESIRKNQKATEDYLDTLKKAFSATFDAKIDDALKHTLEEIVENGNTDYKGEDLDLDPRIIKYLISEALLRATPGTMMHTPEETKAYEEAISEAFSEFAAKDDKYAGMQSELAQDTIRLQQLAEAINSFESVWGQTGYKTEMLEEAITEEGWQNLQIKLADFRNTIDLVNTFESDVNNFKNTVAALERNERNLSEMENDFENFDEEGIRLLEQTIADNKKAIEDFYAKYSEMFSREASEEDINKVLEEYKETLKNSYEVATEAVKSYYQHLVDNNMVSGNDRVLKETLFLIGNQALSLIKTDEVSNDVLSNLPALEEGEELPLNGYIEKIKDFFSNLAGGNIGEAITIYNDLLAYTKKTFEEASLEDNPETYVKSWLSKYTNGLNVKEFIDSIQDLKNSITNYSVIPLLRNLNLSVDQHTLNVLEILEKEQGQFLKAADDQYIIQNPAYEKALRHIPELMFILMDAVGSSYNGFSKEINRYRTAAGKTPLFDELAESSKNIIYSDIVYLASKAAKLIDLSEAAKTRKRGFHKSSEIKIKTDFMKGLFFAKDGDSNILTKLKEGRFSIDLEDLWAKSKNEGDPEYDSVDVANFAAYNARLIRFFDSIYDHIENLRKTKADDESDEAFYTELGTKLASLFDADAYKLMSGEITAPKEDVPNITTNYTTVVFLAAIMGAKSSDVLSKLKGVQQKHKNIIPIIGQSWNIQLGVSIAENNTLFNALSKGLKVSAQTAAGDNIESMDVQHKYLYGKTLLENFMFVQGGAGAGKSSVVAKFIVEVVDALHEDRDVQVITLAPAESQRKIISKAIGTKDEYSYTLTDFLDKICKDWKALEPDLTYQHTQQFDPTKIKLADKSNELFKYNDDTQKKLLIFDEATFASEGMLQIITAWAKANNVTIIAMGDKKQNGYKNEKGITSGIEDCLYITGPELTESIRVANIAKADNLTNLGTTINYVLNAWKDNPWWDSAALDKALSVKIKDATPLSYYHDTGRSFVGEKFIKKEDAKTMINEFIKLSSDARIDKEGDEKKPSVAIITDSDDYKEWSDKGVTVITAKDVQGGEFDYVLIDKNIIDESSKFNSLRDLYTLISRSRIGSAIVGDLEKFKNEFNLTNPTMDESVKDAPVSFASDADDLIKWNEDALASIEAAEVKSTPEEKKEEKKDEPKKDTEKGTDSSEKKGKTSEKKGTKKGSTKEETTDFGTESPDDELLKELDSDLDSKEFNGGQQQVSEQETSTENTVDSEEKIQKIIETSVQKSKVKEKKAKTKKSNITYDRGKFIDYINSDAFMIDDLAYNDSSILSDEDKASEGKILAYREFVQKFSSAFAFGLMDLSSARDILLSTNLGEEWVDYIIDQYNIESETGSRKFVAKSNNSKEHPRSIIYYQVTKDGKEYSIPIGTVDGRVEGTVIKRSDSPIFKTIWNGSMINTANNESIPLREALSGKGKLFELDFIFAPKSELEDQIGDPTIEKGHYSIYENSAFADKNSGQTFSIWSECELLTEEDIKNAFVYKKNEKGNAVLFIDGEILDTNGKDYTYRLSNGAIIHLIISHRTITMASAYDTVSIMRFLNNNCRFEDLSQAQKMLLGNINSKDAAKDYLRTVLGDVSGLNMLTGSANTDAQRKAIGENLKLLSGKYKLFTPAAKRHLLGELWITFEHLKDKYPTWWDNFNVNLMYNLRQGPRTAKVTGNTVQAGLKIGLKDPLYKDGKDDKHKYPYKYFFAKQEISNGKAFYNIYEMFGKGIGKTVVASIPAEGIITNIEGIINTLIKEQKSFSDLNYKWGSTDIKAGNIILGFSTLNTIKDTGETLINDGSDYEHIFSIFNKISNFDFNVFEEALRNRDGAYFKNGVQLNDNGGIYNVSDEESAWREHLAFDIAGSIRRADIASIESSLFSLDAEFSENVLNEESEEEPEEIETELPIIDSYRGMEAVKDGDSYILSTPISVNDAWLLDNVYKKDYPRISQPAKIISVKEDGTLTFADGAEAHVKKGKGINIKDLKISQSNDAFISKIKQNLVSLFDMEEMPTVTESALEDIINRAGEDPEAIATIINDEILLEDTNLIYDEDTEEFITETVKNRRYNRYFRDEINDGWNISSANTVEDIGDDFTRIKVELSKNGESKIYILRQKSIAETVKFELPVSPTSPEIANILQDPTISQQLEDAGIDAMSSLFNLNWTEIDMLSQVLILDPTAEGPQQDLFNLIDSILSILGDNSEPKNC